MVKRVLFNFFEKKVKKQNEGELPLVPLLYPKKFGLITNSHFVLLK